MLTTIDRVLFLMRAPVTSEATTDALARLAQLATEVDLPVGERLFGVGELPDAMYLILDGAVRVEGLEVATRLGPGDAVGGIGLFALGPHVASATAVAATRALKIDRADLHDLLDEDGELARALFSGLLRGQALH